METALIVFRQTVVMFLYMAAGFILFKTQKLTPKGGKDIASMLVYLVIPVVIVNSFCVEYSAEKLAQFLQSVFLGALSLLISIIIAALVFKKDPIANIGTAFSNAGFMGIPLVQAAVGDQGVFFIVGIIAMINILQFTYGVRVMTGEKSSVNIRRILSGPILIGTVIGLILFLTGIGTHLPDVVSTTLSGIAALNAPLAMLVMGSYLAQSDIRRTLTSPHLYLVSAVRLILIPVATLLAFSIIPASREIVLTVFIVASTPIGANVAVYAQLYDRDYPYACQTVVLSTLLSIITLPLLLIAAEYIL